MTSVLHPELALVLDQLFTRHITGEHPEHFNRNLALTKMFETSGLSTRLRRIKSRTASFEDLTTVHDERYVALAKKEIQSEVDQLSTGDTAVCPDSWLVASHAAGSVCAAVDEIYSEESSHTKRAFCAVRPPGHHATPDRGMGFCIFNNIAVGARYAQRKYGVGKVAILDWDVHHGNGTQDIFYEDETVLFCSVHQSPWYPGTGMLEELGSGKGRGFTVNAPLPAGSDMNRIGDMIDAKFLTAMRKFSPELVMISAGFDSRLGDPLGKFRLLDEDYKTLTFWLRKIADEFADGRLISVLEGGYSLEGLAAGVQAHIEALE
ncbi:histone deacetylase [bacterium]|nr:histone deacetylase [Akkermansiaceae bacterium]MDA8960823.1 histone deacetylase [Akkermansiaceae bacterium]MDB4405547.1 histone deacetylase [bacterium]MDB4492442.1 histone deacetylase [Akkermansiaceae bacterium]